MADRMEDAEQQVQKAVTVIRERLSETIYGQDEDTLAGVVTELLRTRGESLSTAESCTGGMLSERLTEIPGVSDVYLGGVVSYSNELKQKLLGVREDTLQRYGAVSPQTAREMALGCLERTGSDWALSITGIAGPSGGSAEKPVGLVYIGCAGRHGVEVKEHRFLGSRQQVRERSVTASLCQLWNLLK
jgi:nicotinamide-nucleotide amidase